MAFNEAAANHRIRGGAAPRGHADAAATATPHQQGAVEAVGTAWAVHHDESEASNEPRPPL